MRIGLLRHAIAEDSAASDFERALTHAGWEQLECVLDALGRTGWEPGTILYSRFVRAAETAEAVHRRYPHVPCLPLDAIAIGVLDPILMACARHVDPLLVGHEPTLGRLCARLLGAPAGAIQFDRAGFALLEVDRLPPTHPARMVAFLPPHWIGCGR